MAMVLVLILAVGKRFNLSELMIRGFYHLTVKPKKVMDLDVKFTNWQSIVGKRDQALERGIIVSSDTDLVPAQIRYLDQETAVEIRLKGNRLDHIKGDKWSLRVETDIEKPILGMRRFSLQIPEARNFINEWLFFKALEKESVMALKYDFINLRINGEDGGIYALEEHFSKEVIERNQRREGPILKFNEDNFWLEDGQYSASIIDAFQLAKIEADETQKTLLTLAMNKLEQYRTGKLDPEAVFDFDTWSSYLALADVLGAQRGTIWYNLRFYFNPITGKLEPIPFDNYPGEKIITLIGEQKEEGPLVALMANQEFRAQYLEKLSQFSKESYIEQLLSENKQDWNYFQKLLRQDYPAYTFKQAVFYDTAATVAAMVDGFMSDTQVAAGVSMTLDSIPWMIKTEGNYTVNKGKYSLEQLVEVPKKSKLTVKAGAEITLTGSGGIVSYSPVELLGSEKEPITFRALDHQGQGILIIKALQESRFNYVVFDGLREIHSNDFNTTGAVSFYQSPVRIEHSKFINSQAEDGLNIVSSEFAISNLEVSNTFSDGVDFDFSTGTVADSYFYKTGNDSLDFSGSVAKVTKTKIDSAGDKGVSVGENSQVELDQLIILNGILGIASKDLSEVVLNNTTFDNVEVGVAAYQKKPEFGPATITWDRLAESGVIKTDLIEKGSSLMLPKQLIRGQEKNLAKIYQ